MQRRLLPLLLSILLVALAYMPAIAQDDAPSPETTGAAGIGDPYFPTMGNGGYDAQDYTLVIDVDMAARRLNGESTMLAFATQDLDRFNLDFVGYTVSAVSVNDTSAAFTRDGGELVITPAERIEEGAAFSVTVAYAGSPTGRGWNFHPGGVIVAGQPLSASGWYPVNEHPLDKATYTFRITVPAPYEVAANGALIAADDNPDDTTTFVWKSADPIASYLTTVAIAEFDVRESVSASGIPVRDYFDANIPQATRDVFIRGAAMIDYLETIFGPYPFEAYGVVVHDLDLSFALETQTLSTFGRSFATERVAMHELAHQWFGNSVSLERWQDIWLNEGFATYSEILWIEHTNGEATAVSALRRQYENMARFSAGFQVTPADLRDFLGQLDLGDLVLTPQEAADLMLLLVGTRFDAAEVAAAVAAVQGTGTTLNGGQLRAVLDALTFVTLWLQPDEVYAFLIAVGEEELAAQFEQQPVVGDPTAGALFSGIVYQRGGLTLHVLRLRMGDDAFFDLLRTYAATYHDGNASTADFTALAESISGEDLGDLFDAWLYSPTLPDIPELGFYLADFLPAGAAP